LRRLNWTELHYAWLHVRIAYSVHFSAGDENGPSREPAVLQTTCTGRTTLLITLCINPPARQLIQVDTEHRGGWTQMLGSEASEPRDLLTDRKIAFLRTPPCFEAPAQGNPLEFLNETYPRKTRGMGLLYGENCVILASTVFDWSTRVTDRQTDGRTDRQMELPWHIRAIAMLSRVKMMSFTLYTLYN